MKDKKILIALHCILISMFVIDLIFAIVNKNIVLLIVGAIVVTCEIVLIMYHLDFKTKSNENMKENMKIDEVIDNKKSIKSIEKLKIERKEIKVIKDKVEKNNTNHNTNQIWELKFKKILIWIVGLIHCLACLFVAGFVFIRSKDVHVKNETKKSFIISLIFIILNMLILIINNIGGCFTGYLVSNFYIIINIYICCILKVLAIITYITFIFIALFSKITIVNNDEIEKIIEENNQEFEINKENENV